MQISGQPNIIIHNFMAAISIHFHIQHRIYWIYYAHVRRYGTYVYYIYFVCSSIIIACVPFHSSSGPSNHLYFFKSNVHVFKCDVLKYEMRKLFLLETCFQWVMTPRRIYFICHRGICIHLYIIIISYIMYFCTMGTYMYQYKILFFFIHSSVTWISIFLSNSLFSSSFSSSLLAIAGCLSIFSVSFIAGVSLSGY